MCLIIVKLCRFRITINDLLDSYANEQRSYRIVRWGRLILDAPESMDQHEHDLQEIPTTIARSAADKQAIDQGRYRRILRTNEDYITRLESTPDIVAHMQLTGKDSSFKKSVDVVSDNTLETLLQFNEYKIKDIAEQILDGAFPLYPFRDGAANTGLMYSPYKPIMMFDAMMGNRYNNLQKLSVSATLEAMTRFIQNYHQESEEGQK